MFQKAELARAATEQGPSSSSISVASMPRPSRGEFSFSLDFSSTPRAQFLVDLDVKCNRALARSVRRSLDESLAQSIGMARATSTPRASSVPPFSLSDTSHRYRRASSEPTDQTIRRALPQIFETDAEQETVWGSGHDSTYSAYDMPSSATPALTRQRRGTAELLPGLLPPSRARRHSSPGKKSKKSPHKRL